MTDEKSRPNDEESQEEASGVEDLEIKDSEDAEAVTGGAAGDTFKDNIKTGG